MLGTESYSEIAMKRVIRKLAKNAAVTPAEAADQVDKVVHEMLRKLRRGETAPLPGVGTLTPGPVTRLVEDMNGNNTTSRDRRRSR